MSTLTYAPPPAYRPSLAGGLALLVHLAMAALLFWGFRWEMPQPQPVQLELWAAPTLGPAREQRPSRPAPTKPAPAPAPELKPEPEKPAPASDELTAAADINRPRPPADKPRRTPSAPATPERKPVREARPQGAPASSSRYIPQPTADDELTSTGSSSGSSSHSSSGSRNAALLEQYQAQISQMLRERVILPYTPPGNPVAEFRLRVLASLVIEDYTWLQHSGDAGWDAAAEKAIKLSRQLPPLPAGLSWSPELRTMKVRLCPKSCP